MSSRRGWVGMRRRQPSGVLWRGKEKANPLRGQSQITDICIHFCPLRLRYPRPDYAYQHFHSAILIQNICHLESPPKHNVCYLGLTPKPHKGLEPHLDCAHAGHTQVMTRQPAISFSISFQHPFNRAGGRTSNVRS